MSRIPENNTIFESKEGVEFEIMEGRLTIFHESWFEGLYIDTDVIQKWDANLHNPENLEYWYWLDGNRQSMSLGKAQLIANAFKESGLKDIIQIMLS
jgi:hypothetical protein